MECNQSYFHTKLHWFTVSFSKKFLILNSIFFAMHTPLKVDIFHYLTWRRSGYLVGNPVPQAHESWPGSRTYRCNLRLRYGRGLVYKMVYSFLQMVFTPLFCVFHITRWSYMIAKDIYYYIIPSLSSLSRSGIFWETGASFGGNSVYANYNVRVITICTTNDTDGSHISVK